MTDSVKFIFKTLIKVPCFVLVAYAIFNLFGFTLTYFKVLGLSYVVMQTAVENNYIPPEELKTLNEYLRGIDNAEIVDRASIVLADVSEPSIAPASERRQYGKPVIVGVQVHYRFIWPLMPREQLKNKDEKFIGYGSNAGTTFSGFADDAILEDRREAMADNSVNNIIITYKVPGLQYYPDLS